LRLRTAACASRSNRQIDAKRSVGQLGAGDGLKHQIHRRSALDRLNRAGDMRSTHDCVGMS
jgi:hypothetical protein